MDAATPVTMKPPWALVLLSAIAPLVLLAGLIWWFFHGGSELIDRPVPPIEQISIRRVELKPGEFRVTIRNTGPMPVDMTLVTVDEAIWKAEFSPSRHVDRLEEATVRIPFDWVAGDPYKIELFTANGLAFEKEIAVAIETPRTSARMFLIFAAMGLYVGILPVAFGILWLPFLRRLGTLWINFFLSYRGAACFSGARRASRRLRGGQSTSGNILRRGIARHRVHGRILAHHRPRSISSSPD
jgi:zinc transporter, ZIP family